MFFLLACSAPTVTPPEVVPAHDDDPVAPSDETVTFSPASFTIEGAFAWDPALDQLVPWTELTVVERDTHMSFTFFDAAGAPVCVAELAFAPSGDDAPELAVWSFEDPVTTDEGPLNVILDHYAFVETPISADNDCPALDPAVWGTDDIGDVLLGHSWGVGFGASPFDLPEGVDAHAFSGSIAGRPVAEGRPAIDAVAWVTAAKLDEDHVVMQDIRDMSAILYAPEDVLGEAPPPRARYQVTASVAWDAARLLP